MVINEPKYRSESPVESMQDIRLIVEKQLDSATKIEDKFESIADAINIVKEVTKNIDVSAASMNINKDKVIELIGNLSAISEENAAGTEEVAASMGEQAATVAEISNSGESLALVVEDLRALIKEFKI